MKSIFVIAIILALSALFFLIYLNQIMITGAPETPILPGIGTFRGPSGPPPATYTPPTPPTSMETFSPSTFIGPSGKPKIIGPSGPPPSQ